MQNSLDLNYVLILTLDKNIFCELLQACRTVCHGSSFPYLANTWMVQQFVVDLSSVLR